MNIQSYKASFEKISNPYGSSFFVRQFDQQNRNTHPYWHYHPEIELVYVNGGRGKRHIGSHLSYFQDGELILIGSNLPHQGFTDRLSNYSTETVIQMHPDFLGDKFFEVPEMSSIQTLFERSKLGLSYSEASKQQIGPKIEKLPSFNSFKRLLGLIEILHELSFATDFKKLNSESSFFEVATPDNDRLHIILNYIRQHFKEQISIPEIADIIHMTETSFCRYFKKTTGKTFTKFLNEYRLVHASKLLSEKKVSINEVCFQSGFTNYSHFNKQFKNFTGKSPTSYRMESRQFV